MEAHVMDSQTICFESKEPHNLFCARDNRARCPAARNGTWNSGDLNAPITTFGGWIYV